MNNNVLNFDNLLEKVLNGTFNMSLPTTFNKIVNANPADNAKQASARDNGERNGGGKKKKKSKNGNDNLIRTCPKTTTSKSQQERCG
jgi:hypothetical protein